MLLKAKSIHSHLNYLPTISINIKTIQIYKRNFPFKYEKWLYTTCKYIKIALFYWIHTTHASKLKSIYIGAFSAPIQCYCSPFRIFLHTQLRVHITYDIMVYCVLCRQYGAGILLRKIYFIRRYYKVRLERHLLKSGL